MERVCYRESSFSFWWIFASSAKLLRFSPIDLRPAAQNAGVRIPDGHRWGLYNLRHSLSNWLVNKAKENPKTVQGILGHSRIQTTLDLYTDEDLDEMIAAQEKFLDAVGFESGSVQ